MSVVLPARFRMLVRARVSFFSLMRRVVGSRVQYVIPKQ